MFIKRSKNKKGKTLQFDSPKNEKEEIQKDITFLNKKHNFPYSTLNQENHQKKFFDNLEINKNNSLPEKTKDYKVEKISLDEKPKIIQEKGIEEKMKVPFFFKVNSLFDYAPGICKDFKETGYCGFGETCIFVHDRGDYKLGWELERDWQKMQKIKHKKKLEKMKKKIENGENVNLSSISSSSSCNSDCENNNEKISSICKICNMEMKEPVSVSCGHIFCEKCIIGKFKENKKKCIICNKVLNGIFNNANKIIEHIKNLQNKSEKNENKNKNRSRYTLIGKEKNYPNEQQNKFNDIDFNEVGNNLKKGEEIIYTLYDDKNEKDKRDNFDYLDKNRNNNLDNLIDNLNEENIIFTKEKKIKNKIKQQNDWLYKSNYSKY